MNKLNNYDLEEMYTYTPRKGDDQLLIIRCEVSYDPYISGIDVRNYKWSVLTKKQTLSISEDEIDLLPNDPLECDEDGNRLHNSVYNYVPDTFLKDLIGAEFLLLIKQACILHGTREKQQPRKLSPPPIFVFANDFKQTNSRDFSQRTSTSTVKLMDNTDRERYYDENDLNKSRKHVMSNQHIGVFNYGQYYYFDMTSFQEKYYLNVTHNQISGILYNVEQSRYYGLERHEEEQANGTTKHVFTKNILLENEWVERTFEEDFLKSVREKALCDEHKYVKCPIGNSKITITPDYIKCNPKVQYLQSGIDNCIFASLASVLHYMNYESLAFRVWEIQKEFQNTSFDAKSNNLLHDVGKKIYASGFRDFNRFYQMVRIKAPEKFNLLEFGKCNTTTLLHVVPIGKDKSANHCIAIYKNFIFDGNYTHAWPLSNESLYKILKTDYRGIDYGYMYIKKRSI
jgi:hypothetical protein